MREQVVSHISLYPRAHDMPARRRVVARGGVDNAQQDIEADYFYYQLRRQVMDIVRRAVGYLPHYQRQGDLAYGGHRGAEHIEGEQSRIFFIVRQEPFEHPAVAAGVVPGQTNTPNQAVIYQNYTTFISL